MKYDIEYYLKNSEISAKEFATFTQKQVDSIVKAVAKTGIKYSKEFAKLAVEETGMGRWEDKVEKNLLSTEYIYEDIKNLKTVGVISNSKKSQIMEIAHPLGPILAIIPVTNPTSTLMFKILIALKTRNPIIISLPFRAKEVCSYVAKKLNMDDFKFSTSYLFFWDKMEKANYFLEKAISNANLDIRDIKYQRLLSYPVDDGGYWQGAVNLVKKYGAAPISAMPEVNSDESSSAMVRNLTYVLRNYAYELKDMKSKGVSMDIIRKKKVKYLSNIYRMLVLHLGEPVKSFYFRYYKIDKNGKKHLTPYKKYTPKEFAKEFINDAFDNFVMFANWPARKYYKLYVWEGSSNSIEGYPLTFINLPMKEIKPMMIESIKNGVTVNFSADVGKQLDRKRGIMNADLYKFEDVYGIEFNTDKKRNTLIRNINSTHAMVITGLDIKDEKPLKWRVENSWGTKNGDNGFYAMYDNWVDLYVVRVVIDKKFIPNKYLKILKTKPIIIPEIEPEK